MRLFQDGGQSTTVGAREHRIGLARVRVVNCYGFDRPAGRDRSVRRGAEAGAPAERLSPSREANVIQIVTPAAS
jgi:hypothetical protein